MDKKIQKVTLSAQRIKILILVVGIMIGILFSTTILPSSSYAETEQISLLGAVATPVPGGPGYIMISPSSFHADTSSASNYSIDIFNRYLEYDGSTSVNLYAPVQLPHGAKITKITYYCYNDTIYQNYATLLRSSPADYGTEFDSIFFASAASTSENQTIIADTPLPDTNVVDNSRYSYGVHVLLAETGQRLYGVRIDYEYGNFLPVATKN